MARCLTQLFLSTLTGAITLYCCEKGLILVKCFCNVLNHLKIGLLLTSLENAVTDVHTVFTTLEISQCFLLFFFRLG